MDIFGFFPQSLQGADILSTSDKHESYTVFMPDWFEGEPADISIFPPDTKEKGEKLGAFFANQGAPPKTVARVPGMVKALNAKYPSIKTWGVVGVCSIPVRSPSSLLILRSSAGAARSSP